MNPRKPTTPAMPVSAVRMLAQQDANIAIIDIFEPISEGGSDHVFSARRCMEMIDYARERQAAKIVLRINSPGGSVIEALAIYDLLKGAGLALEAEIYGIAASAATVVALACPIIRMAPQSQWMVHEPVTFLEGDLDTLHRNIDWFAGVRERIFKIYAAATGKTEEEVMADHAHEVYYTPEEAKAYGWPVELLTDREAAETEEAAVPDVNALAEDEDPDKDDPSTTEDPADPSAATEDPATDDPGEDDTEKSTDPQAEDNSDDDEKTPAPTAKSRGLLAASLRRKQPATAAAPQNTTKPAIKQIRAQLATAKQQLAAAHAIIARMQADARANADNFDARLNAREAAIIAARGCPQSIAPAALHQPAPRTRAEMAKAYKQNGLAGLLRSL